MAIFAGVARKVQIWSMLTILNATLHVLRRQVKSVEALTGSAFTPKLDERLPLITKGKKHYHGTKSCYSCTGVRVPAQ